MRATLIKAGIEVVYIPKDKRSGLNSDGWEHAIIVEGLENENVLISKVSDRSIITVHRTDIFLNSSPWLAKFDNRRVLSADELLVGHIYVTVEKNPGYVFRAEPILSSMTERFYSPNIGILVRGGDLLTNFGKYRLATEEEKQLLIQK